MKHPGLSLHYIIITHPPPPLNTPQDNLYVHGAIPPSALLEPCPTDQCMDDPIVIEDTEDHACITKSLTRTIQEYEKIVKKLTSRVSTLEAALQCHHQSYNHTSKENHHLIEQNQSLDQQVISAHQQILKLQEELHSSKHGNAALNEIKALLVDLNDSKRARA